MIPQDVIDMLTSRVSIVDVIGRVTEVKKRGKNYFALCPFHNEKTPSFSINEEKGLYHCFGCGASGNTITFLMDYYRMDFKEALYELGKMAGIDISQYETTSEGNVAKEKKALTSITVDAMDYFHETLIKNEDATEARKYLEGRKITFDTIKLFKLGYNSEKYPVWKYLQSKGHSTELIVKSGLGLKGNNGLFDRFRERVIFPIFDANSNPVGFGGRIITDRKDVAKYLNSPETPIFHKGELLFGLNFAKNEIETEKCVFLVEGYMDMIGLFQAGIKNVVAPLGTSLTETQLLRLKRFTENIVFVFDGDEAGIKAADRAVDISTNTNVRVKVVILPKGMDPFDFVTNYGRNETLSYFTSKQLDPVEFKLKFLAKKYSIQNDKINFLKNIFDYIKKIQSSIAREEALRRTSNFLNESFRVILTEYQNYLKKDITFGRTIKDVETHKVKEDQLEIEFLAYLIAFRDHENIEHLFDIVSIDMLENEYVKNLVLKIREMNPEDVKNIIFEIQDEKVLNVITRITLDEKISFESAMERAYGVRLKYLKKKFEETDDIILKKELKKEVLEIENIIRSFVAV